MCCGAALTKVPIDMQVSLTGYKVDGAMVAANSAPYLGITFGTPCLQVIEAERDAVTFQYVLNGTISGGPAVSTNAYVCYSTWSQIGRPWRATSAAKDTLVGPWQDCVTS